jgi:DNA-binding transcriptional LysR family regulator
MPDLLGITFRQLQAFTRIAELGSFAAAADALDVAPPSVSGHVSALEARCGKLFDRLPGGRVRLTANGQILRRRATLILAEMRALAQDLAGESAAAETVRIAAADYLYGRLKDIAADYLIAHPGMAIHATVIGSADEGAEALRSGKVDLFFVTRIGQAPAEPDTLLGPAAAGLFATPALIERHRLDDPDAVLPIIISGDAAGEGVVETVLRLSGINRTEIFARVQHVHISRAMCLRGAGVALLYDELVKDEIDAGLLVRLPHPIRCLWRHCHVRPGGGSAAARAFLAYARDRLVAGGSLSAIAT